MAKFEIPTSVEPLNLKLKDFKGVDFTNNITDIDLRRSPNSYNIINIDGVNQKRNGYKIMFSLTGNVNGLWNIDTTSEELIIAHIGTKLYEIKSDFSSYIEIKTGLADKISTGLVFNGKLLILDGLRTIIYDSSTKEVKYLDEIGYIPTTVISRGPSGGGKTYEATNMIQPSRINMFLGTETDTIYQLDKTNISTTIPIIVEVLSTNGEWVIKTLTTDYTVNHTAGTITFLTAPGKSPVIGRDNIRIRFGFVNTETTTQINKCTIVTVFGYNGNNNRVFVTGNSSLGNVDWYSAIDDCTYFPDTNVRRIGLITAPIMNYNNTNDGKLAIHKDVSDTDATIYHTSSLMYGGEEKFDVIAGTKGIGSIAKNASATLLNEPLILSKEGVHAIVSISNNDERYAKQRSYYVNGKLLKESNLKNAVATVFEGKYYLAINNNVYVADSRFLSKEKNSSYTDYQYEWYYFTGLPVRIWFVFNGELYFGDNAGHICKFRSNSDKERYKDNVLPVQSYWDTPLLDFGVISKVKTLKNITIASNPDLVSDVDVGYILKGGIKEVLKKVYTSLNFPKVTRINKKAKKIMYMGIYIESKNATNMCFSEISIQYVIGGKYRGD